MLFNSFEFIFILLPFTFFIYFWLNSKRLTVLSKSFLVAVSLFFYSYWSIAYLPILLTSLLFNFAIGSTLSARGVSAFNRKGLVLSGVIFNLGLLIYFKYADFFIENINIVTGANTPTLDLALPLAISFFTFQQIAYLIDSYRYETKEYDLLNYAVFVTFFPQLIAGPIVHHKEMMPQFANIRNKFGGCPR